MIAVMQSEHPSPPQTETEKLCHLLLKVAGRDTNRLPSVIRHARTLDAALPFMSIEQKTIAIERINRLQTKWGSLLPGDENEPENGGIPPEERIDRWLSQRRYPGRYLRILYFAACAVADGVTSMSLIQDRAYRGELDGLIAWVRIDSFKEWLLQLRIARRETKGIYVPGPLCRWWIEEMNPAGGRHTAYAACLKRIGARVRF